MPVSFSSQVQRKSASEMSQGVGEREKTFAFCKCHTALNGFYYPSRITRSHTAPDFKFFSGYVFLMNLRCWVKINNSEMTTRIEDVSESTSLVEGNGMGAQESD
ncbi:hypothetical protein RUM44_007276 [Polyplax serrata]|uniref:Uncharacterized protein n=1 Tax=Polyplax serrata TaxID=468196 RepID=A0ABR1B0B2_POLSC